MRLAAALAAVVLAALAGPAAAQRPEWRLHEAPAPPPIAVKAATTPRFVFYATPDAVGAARALSKHAEAIRTRIAEDVGTDYQGRSQIRVALGEAEFQALQPRGAKVPSWAAGVAFPGYDLVVINARGGPREDPPAQILAHEVSHLALGRLAPGAFPRWFLEGMAIYHSKELDLSRVATLATAVTSGHIIDLDDLTRSWPQDPADVPTAYAESISFVDWLFRTQGRPVVHRLVRHVASGEPFDDALATATGTPVWQLQREWLSDVRLRYTWLPALTSTGFIWGATSLLFVLIIIRRRRRRRVAMDALGDAPIPEPLPPGEGAEIIPFPHEPGPGHSAHRG